VLDSIRGLESNVEQCLGRFPMIQKTLDCLDSLEKTPSGTERTKIGETAILKIIMKSPVELHKTDCTWRLAWELINQSGNSGSQRSKPIVGFSKRAGR